MSYIANDIKVSTKQITRGVSSAQVRLSIVMIAIQLGILVAPMCLSIAARSITLSPTTNQLNLSVRSVLSDVPVTPPTPTNVWQYGDLTAMSYGDGSEMTYAAI